MGPKQTQTQQNRSKTFLEGKIIFFFIVIDGSLDRDKWIRYDIILTVKYAMKRQARSNE